MSDKPVIKIGHLKITDHLILGVSKDRIDKGEETLQKSTLQTEAMLGWQQVADSLGSGDLDAAFLLAPTAMDLFRSGVDVSMLLFTHKTGSSLITNKAANISKVEDFKGKIVLIPYQLSVHHMLLHKLMASAGLTMGKAGEADIDVQLEVMAPVMMNDAIQYDDEGEIAAFIVAEPFGSQAVVGGYGEEFSLSKDLWPKHPCCVFVARNEIIAKHGDAIQELTNSFVNSGNFVAENPDTASEIGAAFLGQEKDVIKKVLTEPADRIMTTELLPVMDDLVTMQDYMSDTMGVLQGKIDMEKFVNTSFAVAAGAK